ncbi:MAG: hypothetical protein KBS86_00380 [Proteobacteria bacterium]|nr:hypothetical protein [Candidatus Enterousia scatequi]
MTITKTSLLQIFNRSAIQVLGASLVCVLCIMNMHDAVGEDTHCYPANAPYDSRTFQPFVGSNGRVQCFDNDGLNRETASINVDFSHCEQGFCQYWAGGDRGRDAKTATYSCNKCEVGYGILQLDKESTPYTETKNKLLNRCTNSVGNPASESENVNINICQECQPGTYSNNGSRCSPCGLGTYQNLTGQSSCNDCGAGTYQNNSGQTSCITCPSNSTCASGGKDANRTGIEMFECNDGYTYNENRTGCVLGCSTSKECSTWSSEYNQGTYDECSGEDPATKCYKTCTWKCSDNETDACPDYATCTYNKNAGSEGRQYPGGSCDAPEPGKCPVEEFTCVNNSFTKTANACVCNTNQWIHNNQCTACPDYANCDGKDFYCPNNTFTKTADACECGNGTWLNPNCTPGPQCVSCPTDHVNQCGGTTLMCTGNYRIQFDDNRCNATCVWNDCPDGSWGNENGCHPCPTDTASFVKCGGNTLTCAPGYYYNNETCTSCGTVPTVFTEKVIANQSSSKYAKYTSAAGATSITDCYLAPGKYYDISGTVQVNSNCPYKAQ